MARVHVLCGAVDSERSAHLDKFFFDAPGRTLLLAPSRSYATQRRDDLILGSGIAGVWGNFAYQMTDFARELLAQEGHPVTLLEDSFQRLLLMEQCLESLPAEGQLASLVATSRGPGLTRHLLQVVNRLKQAAVEPDEFRKRTVPLQRQNPFHELVAFVYEEYQQALIAANAYDVPGLYWEAVLQCHERKPKALRDIDVLVLDGFDDFTPSEFRFLKALEGHVDTMVFALNYDHTPGRQDLYAIPRKTFGHIHDEFEAVYEHFETPSATSFSTHVANNLFWRDPPQRPPRLAANLDIVSYPNPEEEMYDIARQVKALILDEGVAADGIAVVYRNLGRNAATLRAVFAELGIPVRVTSMPSLGESAIARYVLNLVTAIGAWSRDAVIDTLSAPWFAPTGLPALNAHVIPLLVRNARIVGGQREWRVRLEKLLKRIERGNNSDLERLLARVPDAATAVAALLERVAFLEAFLVGMPSADSIASYALSLDALLDKINVDHALENFPNAAVAEKERLALVALRKLLASLADSPSATTVTRNAFLNLLKQGISESTFQSDHSRGGVTVTDPPSIRNLQFGHVFFAGLNEGVTPAPPEVNAIYGEGDIERLDRIGVRLEGRREHSARERLLLHHIVAAASERLTITYSLTKSDGREGEASAYLEDIASVFPDDIRAEIFQTPARPTGNLASLVSLRDLRNTALFTMPNGALRSSAAPADHSLGKLFEPECAPQLLAAHLQARRDADTPFDAIDGVLADPALVGQVSEAYGPTHAFSVAQLETYIRCPFRFFVERLLYLQEDTDRVGELEPVVHGQILHQVLQRAHEAYRGKLLVEIPRDEITNALDGFVGDAFSRLGWRDTGAAPAVLAVEAERMKITLRHFMNFEHALEEKKPQVNTWRPEHFELAFGSRTGESADPLSVEDAFVLDTSLGPIHFAGRIDRVDVGTDGVRIIDYKSSASAVPAAGDIKDGASMQLSIYAWAIEQHLLKGHVCQEAHFVPIGKGDRREALGKQKKKDDSEARRENTLAAISASITGIRNAQFPPLRHGKTCFGCGAAHVCRYEQNRIERKALALSASQAASNPDATHHKP
jgi:ATP-dependent helicase/nuclease subunit B